MSTPWTETDPEDLDDALLPCLEDTDLLPDDLGTDDGEPEFIREEE